jgi:protein-disulfide isomerase
LQITRREFSTGLAVAGFSAAFLTPGMSPGFFDRAFAQTVNTADLLKPGPLPEVVMGAENAPVTIVEYASLTCPHCRNFLIKTFPELKKRYIDTGKVRYIFREFALSSVDLLAIALARCTDKDKYFPFVETLYEKQEQWAVNNPVPPLLTIAKQAGFTEDSFKKCASNQEVIEGIKSQRDAAVKFGVQSTPSFFINGVLRAGDVSIEELEKLIQPHLKAG